MFLVKTQIVINETQYTWWGQVDTWFFYMDTA